MTDVRIGLVGYGFGGRYFHAPLIASAAGCDFLGIVTRDPDRRRQAEAEYPRQRVYRDLAELHADGAEAVSISTPAATHAALARQALDLGLAVVVDKPFAMNADDGEAVIAYAAAAGRPLTVYQNRRWDSDFRTLCRLVADGDLGQIRRFESRFEKFRPESGPRVAGGGALLDLGSHLVDQALQLLGPVSSVYAEGHQRDTGLDDDVFLALTHHSGAVSHLWASWLQGAPGPRLRVTGATGSFVVEDIDGQEALLLAGESPASLGAAWGLEPQQRWGTLHRGSSVEAVPAEPGGWNTFYPAFAAAVRGVGPVPVDPADAVAALRVIDTARALALPHLAAPGVPAHGASRLPSG